MSKHKIAKDYERSVQELYESFPIVMRTRPYISVDVGWHSLIEDLCFSLEKLCKNETQNNDNLPYINDMKEKYGSLSVSVYGVLLDDEIGEKMWKLIDECEELSSRTCEECGRPGSATQRGWIKTLCEEHSHE
jgi:hypothetical protein